MASSIAPGYWEPKQVAEPSRGLFSIAEVHDGIDPHLLMGAYYETTRCTTGGYWDDLCESTGQEKTFGGTYMIDSVSAAVYDGIKCAPVGMDFDKFNAYLKDSFRPKAEFGAERLLWESFGSAQAVTGADITKVVGLAEANLAAQYGAQGILHMDYYTATLARAVNLLIEPANSSGVVHTITGTPVVLGRGYRPGVDGVATLTPTVGISGHVSVLLGPLVEVTTPPNLDNDVVTMVEQQFVVLAECVSTSFGASA